MEIIMYSTHCPKCTILAKKLNQKNIDFTEKTDVNEMASLGIHSVPVLKVGDEMMDFKTAVNWINKQ